MAIVAPPLTADQQAAIEELLNQLRVDFTRYGGTYRRDIQAGLIRFAAADAAHLNNGNVHPNQYRDYFNFSTNGLTNRSFLALLSRISPHPLEDCPLCNRPNYSAQIQRVHSTVAPRACLDCCHNRAYRQCLDCKEWYVRNTQQLTRLLDGFLCHDCFPRNEHRVHHCISCLNLYLIDGGFQAENPALAANYCTTCRPPDPSKCEPAGPKDFTFPVLSRPEKMINSDTPFGITVGGGTINPAAMTEIYRWITRKTGSNGVFRGLEVQEILSPTTFDPSWQLKEGNFPKRLAKLLLTTRSIKLSEPFMEELTNYAQQHVDKPATHLIAFTRELNLPASEFAHSGSCFWGGYWQSRCQLKAHYGIGVRTFDIKTGSVLSRAWLVPLEPAKAARRAQQMFVSSAKELSTVEAFVLFNAYNIELLPYGRMVASLTGKSYKRITFQMDQTSINNTAGVLIADQEICDRIAELYLPAKACSCQRR